MMLFLTILVAFLATMVASYDSTFAMSKAERYVQLSGAAYCTDPLIGKDSINNWSCNACKAFPNVKATTFHGKLSDANGFVAYDGDANEIIVSFSGTDPLSIKNWIDDLNFFQTDYPYCNGCRVHEGFYNTFNSVFSTVKDLVQSNFAAHPSATLSVTGHSLGAAMAAHCTAELAHLGYNISTSYTYGMPRVGNEAYQNWYKGEASKIRGTFRVVHNHDPVPHVPFQNMGGGFHHMPYEIFYERDKNKWALCNFEGEDNNCSNKFLTTLDVVDHLNYLGFDFTTNYLSCALVKE